jgi:hypothetical protein
LGLKSKVNKLHVNPKIIHYSYLHTSLILCVWLMMIPPLPSANTKEGPRVAHWRSRFEKFSSRGLISVSSSSSNGGGGGGQRWRASGTIGLHVSDPVSSLVCSETRTQTTWCASAIPWQRFARPEFVRGYRLPSEERGKHDRDGNDERRYHSDCIFLWWKVIWF